MSADSRIPPESVEPSPQPTLVKHDDRKFQHPSGGGSVTSGGATDSGDKPNSGTPVHDWHSNWDGAPFRDMGQIQSAGFTADHAAIAIVALLLLALAAALFLDRPADTKAFAPSGNSAARVWIDLQTGLYFCRGEKYYGKGKGRYMTQGEAQRNNFHSASRRACP